MRRDNGPCGGTNCPLERSRIKRERIRINVSEDDLQSCDACQARYDPEREGRHNDLRSLRQVQRLEDVVERHASVRSRDSLPPPGAARKGVFELPDVGSLNELPASFRAGDDGFGFWQDSRSIARDCRQHATGREMSAISSRE